MKFRLRNGWSLLRLAGAALLVALGVAVAWDAWRDIYHIASRDEEASHIFLVPVVAAYLIWVRRRRLRHMPATSSWLGPALVLSGWLLLNWGEQRLWQSVFHLGAILIVVGCLVTAIGSRILREFAPAFLVLVFLIPVPGRFRQRVAMPMQNATAQVTEGLFDVLGIEVTRSGNLLRCNGVDVAIAEACNGLRMVFALGLVCYAFAFGNPLRPYARFLVLAASPLAAIVCNVIRLIPTVYVYGYYPNHVADQFHALSGWVMLFVAFFLLMGILRTLRWAMIPVYRFTLAYD